MSRGRGDVEITENAGTDHPPAIMNRALDLIVEACASRDRTRAREAAEMAWLAACAVADHVALVLDERPPRGYARRLEMIEVMEDVLRRYSGVFAGGFAEMHGRLHGEIFHEDEFHDEDAVHEEIGKAVKWVSDAWECVTDLKAPRGRRGGG